ncbi:MAG: pyruvate kinase [Helicobacteraceae bacterium]|nr:pyruvate kinase [Helicobacteraceae bacterium]
MKKRVKILATIGPASDNIETLEKLILAGVNVFRLNFSHGTHEYHSKVLANIREAMVRTKLLVGILQDICGPKVRVGVLKEDFLLNSGDKLEFFKEEIEGRRVGDGSYRLSLSNPAVLQKLKVDEYIYLYDGIIKLKVIELLSDRVVTLVENSAKLSSNKGVNFPNTRIDIEVLTPKDREDMAWGVRNSVDFMAISFVQNSSDMKQAREIINDLGGDTHLFAKIEKFDAIENIDEILEYSDGLMVARGDLGIEVPYYRVPQLQKMLIKKANEASKPVITATQMLLSMTTSQTATRAEISDVANAVLDGTDAVMLSEESAVGVNPVLAVETMTNTIVETEKIYPFNKFGVFEKKDATDVIDESATRLASDLSADAILVFTYSGQTVKKLARFRCSSQIYAITHNYRVSKRLTIVWGVVPAFMVKESHLEHMMSEVIKNGIKRQIMSDSGTYVLTAGYPIGISGSTNSIQVLREYELKHFME